MYLSVFLCIIERGELFWQLFQLELKRQKRKLYKSVSQVVRRAIKDFLLMDKMNKAVDALNKIPN